MIEDLKRCSKCKIEKLMIKFPENNKQTDGLYDQCNVCGKENHNENII